MLGRSTALVARRVASLLSLKQCVCTLCRQLPRASANRLTAEPTSSVFYEQKRCSQIEVFGPLDPPKQLTFKQVHRLWRGVISSANFSAKCALTDYFESRGRLD